MSTFQQYNISPWLTPVRLVATSNQTGTYNNGPLNNGVGATFTYGTGALTIDSVAVNVGDRILFAAQSSAFQNGIYVVTNAGATGVSAVLQRSADFQCIEQVHTGFYVTISAGTANGGSAFVMVEPKPAILGISNMVWQDVASSANIALPTIINHIATYTSTGGALGEDAATAINGGNIQAGLSGTAGTLGSFPSAASSGELLLAAVTNSSGNFNTTISNASAVGQSQVVSIPDGGASTSNFIISNSAGTQTIGTGNLAVSQGNVTAGSSGHAGFFTSFPGTAANGSFLFKAVNNAGGFNSTLSNSNIGQATVYSLPDPGVATTNLLLADNAGTQHITTGSLSVDVGNISAGSSGHAGTVSSFPGTAANGSLILAGVNAGGAFNTTISNGTMGQSTVYTMGDIGTTTGGLVVATDAIRMKSVAAAAVAGGAAAQTVTDAFCTSTSNVIANWNDTTNPVQIQKVAAGNGSFVVTSTADPGASHLNYIIIK